ncbi:MAG: ABC transporter permease, partial [Planctomycetaceae bacterium]|nr:ABC transporter permease [Planctomycetaceae bacterium]
VSGEVMVFVVLAVVALILVNTQAVTSLTTERDGQTLELLLVTEVSAREFVFSKMGGIFFNSKEIILAPMLYLTMAWVRGGVDLESLIFSLFGFLILVVFAATLGLHQGFAYTSSRSAILNSMGTVFLLFVGTFICMILMVESRSSFALQFVSFLGFIGGGSLGLWSSLTHRISSTALAIAASILPFLTFYAVVSFLLEDTAAVFAALGFAYLFTTAAMLIPAVSAFEVALGRATLERG